MKEKIISIVFVVIIFTFGFLSIILKDKDISLVERRKLVNVETLKEDFNENLDKYLTDQFPLRDEFLALNSAFNRYFLNNKDYNGVYLKDDYIFERLYPLDNKSVNNFTNKINYIKEKYLKNNSCYYMIIPDKSYFLDSDKYLTIDYDYLYSYLNDNINFSRIDIRELLKLDDYYKTDIHLKQKSYFKVIDKLSDYFKFNNKDISYTEKVYSDFKGATFYKVPFSKPEELIYLTNDILENVRVKHLEYKDNYVYKEDAFKSSDAYNVFLSGPSSLIEIINDNAYTDKELIIFRDSFGSSIAPLLVPFYKKITLVDLRYINMNLVNNYISFDNQDVLFLYSTLIVNNSFILKIN